MPFRHKLDAASRVSLNLERIYDRERISISRTLSGKAISDFYIYDLTVRIKNIGVKKEKLI